MTVLKCASLWDWCTAPIPSIRMARVGPSFVTWINAAWFEDLMEGSWLERIFSAVLISAHKCLGLERL